MQLFAPHSTRTAFNVDQVGHKIAGPLACVQLRIDDFIPCCAAGIIGAGQAENKGIVGQPRKGARLNGGGAYLGKANVAKQFAKTFLKLTP